jgi:hypothetical protein
MGNCRNCNVITVPFSDRLLRPDRGYSATKYDEGTVKPPKSLRPQKGGNYDDKLAGHTHYRDSSFRGGPIHQRSGESVVPS